MPETPETEVRVKILNRKGLHARAAAKFVKTAGLFDANFMVAKVSGAGIIDEAEVAQVSGSSILGLMMLGAEYNSTLRLRVRGAQAKEAVDAICRLIGDKFGEE